MTAWCGYGYKYLTQDARKIDKPIMEVGGHTHWVWSVSYNKSHDQMILSGGSDCQVNLQSIVTVSSVPLYSSSADLVDDEEYEW
jgi:EARP and GARP complex-interacting protein 1